MCWSFSRDGAVPGHSLWSRVNPYTGTPINAVCFMVTLAFILGLPMLNSTVAFNAVISISVIGLYISCARPRPPSSRPPAPTCRHIYDRKPYVIANPM